MSSTEQDEVCASCGIAEIDDKKLKKCACNLVKYCSVECQKNHRPQHKKVCKKRLAEIRDDRLFQQPDESHWGECPLCCLPLPLDSNKLSFHTCCCKIICQGCEYADFLRARQEGLDSRCAFCREPMQKNKAKTEKNWMDRIKANDPIAIREMGKKCYREGDLNGAIQYWTKAAGLGDIDAHYELAGSYHEGQEVEKDMKKAVYLWEEAAIGGHPSARYNLGVHEARSGRGDRAMKHFIIAAKLGHDLALEAVTGNFRRGLVSKEEYEAALRGHQAAVDATKSQQREEAYVASRGFLGN
jgi:hypothetical protein